jgi:hypothetical protein
VGHSAADFLDARASVLDLPWIRNAYGPWPGTTGKPTASPSRPREGRKLRVFARGGHFWPGNQSLGAGTEGGHRADAGPLDAKGGVGRLPRAMESAARGGPHGLPGASGHGDGAARGVIGPRGTPCRVVEDGTPLEANRRVSVADGRESGKAVTHPTSRDT